MGSAFQKAFKTALAPESIDTFKLMGYIPTERQALFHKLSKERYDAILYGGAASGGKSTAMLHEMIYNAANYPNMRIGAFRRSYSELEESFIAPLANRWNFGYAIYNDLKDLKGAKPKWPNWNATKYQLQFPNGSVINFQYASNVVDVSKILGGEYQLFCVDEASLVSQQVLDMVEERLRSGDLKIPVIGFRAGTNPGGISSSYLKKRFVDPTNGGEYSYVDEKKRRTAFVPAKVTDNPHVDKDYREKRLEAISDPVRRKQMLEGDWKAQVGAIFMEWDDNRHIVPSNVEIANSWRRYAGIDWGYSDPWAVCWAAVDNDGRLWFYREIYATEIDSEHQAQYVLEAEHAGGDKDVYRYADPSMWSHQGALSNADQYGLQGCGLMQANNERILGWSRMHDYLREWLPCEYHRQLGWKTCPGFHVIEGHCPVLVETVPALQRDPVKPDDALTRNVADHMPDAVRYLVMAVGAGGSPVFYDDFQTVPTTNLAMPAEIVRDDGSTLMQPVISVPEEQNLASNRFVFGTSLD